MMPYRKAGITFVVFALAAAAGVAHAREADPPPAPQDSKSAAPAAKSQEPAKAPTVTPAPNGAGMLVFIDPVTHQIVKPTDAQIGSLIAIPQGPAPKAPVTVIQGPGNAVRVKLSGDQMNYVMATKAPDGKIDLDCVTGTQAAEKMVGAAESGTTKETSKAKVPHEKDK